MLNLPEEYTDKMKRLLGDEYEAYTESLLQPSACGLRVNTSKVDTEKFLEAAPFTLAPVPWTTNGFYYDPAADKPSAHPYYHCGLYYLQEPSAMAPAALLPVAPGERVLDLCAAPGGKTTQLAMALQERGLLISNDISPSRAKALLKNIELFGLKNTVVTCEAPEKLAEYFPEFFDKILVDAPCSGEGMFRRGTRMIRAWQEHGPAYFSVIQKEIVTHALRMLRPGGQILYSTCTFDPSEDEQIIAYMMEICPELSVLPAPHFDGFVHGFSQYAPDTEGIENAVRLFPHRIRGDGHFAALMQKGDPDPAGALRPVPEPVTMKRIIGKGRGATVMRIQSYPEVTQADGLRIKRSGLLLGEEKGGKFIPSQAYAMTLTKDDYKPVLNLSLSDERVRRYLKGESLQIQARDHLPEKGTVLVLIDGFPAGWGKINGSRIKNNLLPGWRMQTS